MKSNSSTFFPLPIYKEEIDELANNYGISQKNSKKAFKIKEKRSNHIISRNIKLKQNLTELPKQNKKPLILT